MLVDLQMYQEVFELEFLRETEILYHAESLRIMRDNEFTVRLRRCNLVIFESAIVATRLPLSREEKISTRRRSHSPILTQDNKVYIIAF